MNQKIGLPKSTQYLNITLSPSHSISFIHSFMQQVIMEHLLHTKSHTTQETVLVISSLLGFFKLLQTLTMQEALRSIPRIVFRMAIGTTKNTHHLVGRRPSDG